MPTLLAKLFLLIRSLFGVSNQVFTAFSSLKRPSPICQLVYVLRFFLGAWAAAAAEEEEEEEDEEDEMAVSLFRYFFLLGFRPFLFREPFGRPVVPPFILLPVEVENRPLAHGLFKVRRGNALSTRHEA